ncbi:hypothetical protein Leryth_012860 [Lithospermum erythrorhizon]|nr:hypothetical protein Leryth_012860 [Lithospermum erythrorhizon]
MSSVDENNEKNQETDNKVVKTVETEEAVTSNSTKEPSDDHVAAVHPSPDHHNRTEAVPRDAPADFNQDTKLGDAKFPKDLEAEESQSINVEVPKKTDTEVKEFNPDIKPDLGQKIQDHKTTTSALKVQDQLDEAQGLLKSAVSTGQSKEARLARVCAGLSSRLQEYKSENAQLEELLIGERELSKSYESQIKQLRKELSESKREVNKVESSMTEALAAKNAEIEALVKSMDAVKKQAALTEGNLGSLQANMEAVMRNRELTETRMMQALREELSAVERRAEEERAAHNASKMASMEREVELEHRAMEASTALARIQRTVDERTAKAAELEQNVALLEAECASLNQELQDMEVRARREQKKYPDEANQAVQMQAWQEEVERARQSQREAESKLASLEAEMQKMRVEMAAMKRDAEHYSRQEHMELEKRYRELTDLLYYKQTQLETIASEKAAAEFQLEKEMKRNQEAQVEVERNRISRRASTYWEEDPDMKALEPLPLHNRHMAGASIQLQKAAKLLDTGAVRATRFLWRYPIARVILLFYLVFVHLFLMHLLHRLQEQADSFTSREIAESMGLGNQTLP